MAVHWKGRSANSRQVLINRNLPTSVLIVSWEPPGKLPRVPGVPMDHSLKTKSQSLPWISSHVWCWISLVGVYLVFFFFGGYHISLTFLFWWPKHRAKSPPFHKNGPFPILHPPTSPQTEKTQEPPCFLNASHAAALRHVLSFKSGLLFTESNSTLISTSVWCNFFSLACRGWNESLLFWIKSLKVKKKSTHVLNNSTQNKSCIFPSL